MCAMNRKPLLWQTFSLIYDIISFHFRKCKLNELKIEQNNINVEKLLQKINWPRTVCVGICSAYGHATHDTILVHPQCVCLMLAIIYESCPLSTRYTLNHC